MVGAVIRPVVVMVILIGASSGFDGEGGESGFGPSRPGAARGRGNDFTYAMPCPADRNRKQTRTAFWKTFWKAFLNAFWKAHARTHS